MLVRLLKLCWPVVALFSDESVTKRSDHYLNLKSEQWRAFTCAGPILYCHNIFFSSEENVSISSVFAIVYGLLDQLEVLREESASNTKVIRNFEETVAVQLIERFELTSLDSTHPLLMGSLLDPQFKCIILSKYSEEIEIRKLKQSLK